MYVYMRTYLGRETVFPEGEHIKKGIDGAGPCEALYLGISGLRTSQQRFGKERQGAARSSKEQGAAAGVGAAALRRVTCIACAPTGLGRCTRMHKGLKPRSMSETSHLPTDVESSSQDRSLHYSPAGLWLASPCPTFPSVSSSTEPDSVPTWTFVRPRSLTKVATQYPPHLPATTTSGLPRIY